ncbi:acyltransferase [Asticcacaulis sp. BYS171W]|uniref:Acyltransferase n=1 Tax=Asticcacaulis aquaticus TaxID=2984212 RepID=A0ABT5HXJ1_9CAUL|nr:acyltransferase [Asticcacaulis aquaticus]MDC7684753.1 acyltransferase [Asticcacaulis aquaticus]
MTSSIRATVAQAAATDIKPLTSLRFFAAVWVILFSYWPALQGAIPLGIIDKGYLGVDLFFVLSGFILSHVYLGSLGDGRFQYGPFIVNRLARIYPLHIATLLFAILLWAAATVKGMSVDKNLVNWEALPAHLFLVQAWGLAPEAAFNHPSWSISAEWFAYLLFPVFGTVAWSMRRRPWLALGLSVAFLTSLYIIFEVFMGFPLTRATVFWGALRIVPAFMLGCSLYLLWRSGAVTSRTIAMIGAAAASLTALVAATWLPFDALIVVALGLMLLCVGGLGNDGIMGNRVMVYLGEVSFAMYMVYVPWKWIYLNVAGMVLGTGDAPLPFMWWFAGLVAIVPVAMLGHHLVELPFRKVIRHIGDKVRYRLAYQLAR